MSARSKARKRALDVLYEAELRGTDPLTTLAERLVQADPPIGAYAEVLVSGVVAHQARIDALISECSEGWELDRMPAVDRNVLRLAVFELLWSEEVPAAVALDEAVELAKSLSTEDSPRFVNGVLGRLADRRAELRATIESLRG